MRALIVTDIHGNLTALEAVLAAPQAQGCDRVISLGDQVNFGPQPAQVMARLRSLGATMLLGNHEDRLRRIGEPEFVGYNWSLLHWTYAQLGSRLPELQPELRLGPVLLTHAVPGDPWRLVDEQEVKSVLDELPGDVRYLISGHNHTPWCVAHGGRLAVNPGAAGMEEHERGGLAPFAVLDMHGDEVQIDVYAVPYDVKAAARAFLEGGSAQAAPEMTRAVLHTIRTGTPMYVLDLVRYVAAIARPMGLTAADEEAWLAADRTWPWPEAMSSREYWKKTERDLHE